MTPEAREFIRKKIRRIQQDHPEWEMDRVIAVAYDMARREGYKIPPAKEEEVMREGFYSRLRGNLRRLKEFVEEEWGGEGNVASASSDVLEGGPAGAYRRKGAASFLC